MHLYSLGKQLVPTKVPQPNQPGSTKASRNEIFFCSIRASYASLLQAECLSILKWENQLCCTSVRNLIKDTPLIAKKREEKSPAPNGIRTHNLSVRRRALFHCATTLLQELKSLSTCAKMWPVIWMNEDQRAEVRFKLAILSDWKDSLAALTKLSR